MRKLRSFRNRLVQGHCPYWRGQGEIQFSLLGMVLTAPQNCFLKMLNLQLQKQTCPSPFSTPPFPFALEKERKKEISTLRSHCQPEFSQKGTWQAAKWSEVTDRCRLVPSLPASPPSAVCTILVRAGCFYWKVRMSQVRTSFGVCFPPLIQKEHINRLKQQV